MLTTDYYPFTSYFVFHLLKSKEKQLEETLQNKHSFLLNVVVGVPLPKNKYLERCLVKPPTIDCSAILLTVYQRTLLPSISDLLTLG